MASLRVKPKNLLFPLWSTPRSCEDRSREAPSNAPRRLVILEQALVHFPQCSFEANLRLFQSWTEPINPRHSMGLPYMPTLTPLAPPQLIGIYGIHGVSGFSKGHLGVCAIYSEITWKSHESYIRVLCAGTWSRPGTRTSVLMGTVIDLFFYWVMSHFL